VEGGVLQAGLHRGAAFGGHGRGTGESNERDVRGEGKQRLKLFPVFGELLQKLFDAQLIRVSQTVIERFLCRWVVHDGG
jgi:hypothetical protein